MGRYRASRIAVLLVLVLALALAPWWLTALFAVVAALYYPFYVELLMVGQLYDVWFGATASHAGVITAITIIVIADLLARFIGLRRS